MKTIKITEQTAPLDREKSWFDFLSRPLWPGGSLLALARIKYENYKHPGMPLNKVCAAGDISCG